MKTFSNLVMILLCLLFLQGTAAAVLSVLDDVPAQDLVFPFICAKDDPSGMNTYWAIAETAGNIVAFPGLAGVQNVFVRDRDGVLVMDYSSTFTPLDVVTGNCQTLIQGMSPSMKLQLELIISGESYYAGYITTQEEVAFGSNHYVGWVYLIDSASSFKTGKVGPVAGFKPFQAEGGVNDNNLGEDAGIYPIRAKTVFPRYFILNANSRNWWIVLTAKQPNTLTTINSLKLAGLICDEEEHCVSQSIPINHRLEFIDVSAFLPALPSPLVYPKAGFAKLDVLLTTTILTSPPIVTTPDYSFFMWSYQRECYLAKGKTCPLSWTAMHPVDRFYQYPQ